METFREDSNILLTFVCHIILVKRKRNAEGTVISQNTQYSGVNRRTIEVLQRAEIVKANYCLKVNYAPLKLT